MLFIYSKCVFMALGFQYVKRHIVTCGLFGSTIFFLFNFMLQMARFSKKNKKVIELKTVLIFSTNLI